MHFFEQNKNPVALAITGFLLEATPGFEPGSHGFANQCLTTWLCRHFTQLSLSIFAYIFFVFSNITLLTPYFCRFVLTLFTEQSKPCRPQRSKTYRSPQGQWSGRRGSNSLPPPWQGGALPDELRPRAGILIEFVVPPVGVEPTTRGFSVRCSTN